MLCRLIILVLVLSQFVFAQEDSSDTDYELWVVSQSAPGQFWDYFFEAGLDSSYDVNVTILNPFYYYGDFDGDSETDFATILTDINDGTDQLVILGGNGEIYWLDRDDELEYPTITAWHVFPQHWEIEKGSGENESLPELIGDGLMIIKVEASSALIYWNGKRFVSYWLGD